MTRTLGPLGALGLVAGGTAATLALTFPRPLLRRLPDYLRKAWSQPPPELDAVEVALSFVRLSNKARREGLLSLEAEAPKLALELARKGIQEVVDGTPPEPIQDILESRIAAMEARHRRVWGIFSQGSQASIDAGIAGTLVGLALAAANGARRGGTLQAALFPALAGVVAANVFWQPVSQRLRQQSDAEIALQRLALTGVLSVQAGDAPRLVAAKLEAFLTPEDRARFRAGFEEALRRPAAPPARPAPQTEPSISAAATNAEAAQVGTPDALAAAPAPPAPAAGATTATPAQPVADGASPALTPEPLRALGRCLLKVQTGIGKAVVDAFDATRPDLGQQLRRQMFTFDDLDLLRDRDMARIVRDVDVKDLAMALRGAPGKILEKFSRGMSKRAAEQLREQIEIASLTRTSLIEEAQQKIISVIQRLEQAEEISIGVPGQDPSTAAQGLAELKSAFTALGAEIRRPVLEALERAHPDLAQEIKPEAG